MVECDRAASMILDDSALVSYLFSLPDEEKDAWMRALLIGSICDD